MKAVYHGNTNLPADELINLLLHPPTDTIAVDIETVSLADKTIIGIGIAVTPNDAFYCPIVPIRSEILEQVYQLVTRKDIKKIYHNGNFDIEGLRQYSLTMDDWTLDPPDYWNIGDTNLIANNSALPPDLHTLGVTQKVTEDLRLLTIQGLLQAAKDRLGRKTNITMLDVPLEDVALKCCNDVRMTYRLWEKLEPNMSDKVRDCYNTDIEATSWLKFIQSKGLKLNHEEMEKRYNDLIVRAELYEDWAANEMGFSISSPKQVGDWLADHRIVLPVTKGGRQLDTSDEVLSKVKHPVAKEVLDYREIRHTLGHNIEPFRFVDRQYTHFRLDLATGRLASAGMDCPDHKCTNQQNVPPELRSMYQPDSGWFTYGDMSQAEMRTFAWFTQDPKMLEAYRQGISIHEVTFKGIYPNISYSKDIHEYTLAKGFNFAMIFDAEDSTLAKNFNTTIKVAHDTKQDWLSLYDTAAKWMRDTANTECEYVEDIFGRRMRLPDIFRGQKHINTCKINYTIQGSVASINKRAFNKIMREDRPDMRLQVHDEFIIDGEYEFSKDLDEIYPGLIIPFDVKREKVWL